MPYLYVSNTEPTHFRPTLLWPKKYKVYEVYKDARRNVEDPTSNLFFLNDPRGIVQIKCFLLSVIGVPIYHSILATIQICFSLFKLLFDITKLFLEGPAKFYINLYNVVNDLLKIILAPILVVTLELTAMIGIILPLNARKIFGSLERFMVNEFEVHAYWNSSIIQKNMEDNKGIIAPCFQPRKFYDNSIEMIELNLNKFNNNRTYGSSK